MLKLQRLKATRWLPRYQPVSFRRYSDTGCDPGAHPFLPHPARRSEVSISGQGRGAKRGADTHVEPWTACVRSELTALSLPQRLIEDLLVACATEFRRAWQTWPEDLDHVLTLVPDGSGSAHVEWLPDALRAPTTIRLSRPPMSNEDALERSRTDVEATANYDEMRGVSGKGAFLSRLAALMEDGIDAHSRIASYFVDSLLNPTLSTAKLAEERVPEGGRIRDVVDAWAVQRGVTRLRPSTAPGSLVLAAGKHPRATLHAVLRAYPPPEDLAAATRRLSLRR